MGGLLALGLVVGGAATFAQTDDGDAAPTETPLEEDSGADESTTPTVPVLPGGGHGRPEFSAKGDNQEALAAALGITVEELQAAQAQVKADELAAMVTAGYLTQEQADLMLAKQAVQSYVDQDALQTAVQTVYETAVADALAAGDITQAQADALLSSLSEGLGGLGGFGGPGFGGGGHHGHGGPGGFAPETEELPSTSVDPNA
jgi:hypothetical protein